MLRVLSWLICVSFVCGCATLWKESSFQLSEDSNIEFVCKNRFEISGKLGKSLVTIVPRIKSTWVGPVIIPLFPLSRSSEHKESISIKVKLISDGKIGNDFFKSWTIKANGKKYSASKVVINGNSAHLYFVNHELIGIRKMELFIPAGLLTGELFRETFLLEHEWRYIPVLPVHYSECV